MDALKIIIIVTFILFLIIGIIGICVFFYDIKKHKGIRAKYNGEIWSFQKELSPESSDYLYQYDSNTDTYKVLYLDISNIDLIKFSDNDIYVTYSKTKIENNPVIVNSFKKNITEEEKGMIIDNETGDTIMSVF